MKPKIAMSENRRGWHEGRASGFAASAEFLDARIDVGLTSDKSLRKLAESFRQHADEESLRARDEDAQLMVSAQDLLAIAKHSVEMLEACAAPYHEAANVAVCTELRAAIARAEGKGV